ncbi:MULTISPECIES: FxsA family protein [Gammaproteobacteria]|uniref:FxsA family protein n=1 Tax=Gammaproteobacteria TaxID=1236 RepID=UPI000DCF958D|nr:MULTISPECIES: FxsA family protein [Gammaproteobacteria]RTE85687.1 FxsA family protein [Aliidiomarina sp. B3213]TCZ90312.1 FxsA family protein [Lysobacter sp. N42]
MQLVLFVLFVVMPIIEISVLVQVGQQIGAGPTIALVILTALLGSGLVKQQGLNTFARAQQKMAMGEMPGQELIAGFMILAAGIFLVTPGFVTDALALLMLLPVIQKHVGMWALKKLAHSKNVHFSFTGASSRSSSQYKSTRSSNEHGNTFEGEYSRQEDFEQVEDKEKK